MNDIKKVYFWILTSIFVVQIFLFTGYVEREVSWDWVLHGDPTWYTYFAYSDVFYDVEFFRFQRFYQTRGGEILIGIFHFRFGLQPTVLLPPRSLRSPPPAVSPHPSLSLTCPVSCTTFS